MNNKIDYKESLTQLLKSFNLEGIEVSIEDREGEYHLVITAPDEAKGKIIGKQGKNINAIRSIYRAIASNNGERISISVE